MRRTIALWGALTVSVMFLQAHAGHAACTQPSFTAAEKKAIPTRNINQAVLSRAIMKQTNYYRCRRGLAPLKYDVRLKRVAEIQARNMARLKTMSHVLPVRGTGELTGRFEAADVRVKHIRAENISTEYRLAFGTGVYLIDDAPNCRFTYRASGQPIPPHSYGSLARSVVKRWWGSSGHRANMLNRQVERMGAAARFANDGQAPCGTYYVSQDFAG